MQEKITTDNSFNIKTIESFFEKEIPKLKSFVYRIVSNAQDVEDIIGDTLLTALEKQDQFQSKSNLKTWIYSIASNKAIDFIRKNKRWSENVMDKAKEAAKQDQTFFDQLLQINQKSPYGIFEMKEHISLCFDCISKTLPIEQQVSLLLKDVYQFKVKEIELILNKTNSQIKHYLENARKKMNDIFDRRCALINKKGVCNQCTELNNIFNSKQDTEKKKLELKLVRQKDTEAKEKLYDLRNELVKVVDPLNSEGNEFHKKHLSFICEIARKE